VGFDGFDEVHGVGFGEIFHAEIIDAESERGVRLMRWRQRPGV
jgi:hypothetical protein